MSNENNKTLLTEEQLEHAAGGNSATTCEFLPAFRSVEERNENGVRLWRQRCNPIIPSCHKCKCAGTPACVGGFHVVTGETHKSVCNWSG